MERKTFGRLGWGLFIMAAVWCGLELLFEQIPWGSDFFLTRGYVLFVLIIYGVAAGILWLFCRNLPRMAPSPKNHMSAKQFTGFFCAGRGVSMVLALVGMILQIIILLILNPQGFTDILRQINPYLRLSVTSETWSSLFTACIIAPVVEELMFRKILLDPLRPFGDKIAILYSGIAFGLMHMDIQQIPYTIAMGLFLGYVQIRTNNLWYVIGLHFAVNFTSTLILPVVDIAAGSNTLPSMLALALIILGYSAVLLAACIVGLVLFFKTIKRVRLNQPAYAFSEPVNFRLAALRPGAIGYTLICLGMAVYILI